MVTDMTETNSENTVPRRIASLRVMMKDRGISACIVPTGDPHMSEYISDHYKSREYITGFTGSAGTAVITDCSAALWTDSRYWLQAERELGGSGILLMRDGDPHTPTISSYLRGILPSGSVISAAGDMISCTRADHLRDTFADYGLRLTTDADLIGMIWKDRPKPAPAPIREHPLKYAGVTRIEKIRLVRGDMRRACNQDAALLLPCLDDIAWLLNLRGTDIPCNPVFYAYLILTQRQARLYLYQQCLPDSLRRILSEDGIEILPYTQFYADLATLEENSVLLDRGQCSDRIVHCLPQDKEIIHLPCPVTYRKCIKNETEMEGIRSSHLRDAVAMCRFLCWIKSEITQADQPLTEITAAQKLHELRAAQDLFLDDSFETIAAYGAHGAVVHYAATEETDMPLKPRGLLLVDSGGQYMDGTTDITRTIALGPLSTDEKTMFTTVLRGHIALARAVFPRGMTGAGLDILAHAPLWETGLDYGHGTGHGVGSCLNVHEDPIRIHWASGRLAPAASRVSDVPGSDDPVPAKQITSTVPVLQEGMLTSNEPGYYEAGSFGIRHENLLLCVPSGSSGRFLAFETVTLVPFDRDGIASELMQPDEIAWLNEYHEEVFRRVGPHLNETERKWLREATLPL